MSHKQQRASDTASPDFATSFAAFAMFGSASGLKQANGVSIIDKIQLTNPETAMVIGAFIPDKLSNPRLLRRRRL